MFSNNQVTVYLLARHDNFGGFDADSWHFSSFFLRFDKSWTTGEPERTYILVFFVYFCLFLRLASSLVTSLLLSFWHFLLNHWKSRNISRKKVPRYRNLHLFCGWSRYHAITFLSINTVTEVQQLSCTSKQKLKINMGGSGEICFEAPEISMSSE